MRIAQNKIPAAVQHAARKHPGALPAVWLSGSRMGGDLHGFTLIELIMVIVIVGILAVFVAPRFFENNTFQSRGIADQVQSSLRYAQKVAIAQHRLVAVNITTGASSDCGSTLVGGNVKCQISLPSGVAVTPAPPQTITFNALGQPQPNAQASLVVSGGGVTSTITIEAETGYVH